MRKNSYVKMLGYMALGGVIGGLIGFGSYWGVENGLPAMLTAIKAWIGTNVVLLLLLLLVLSVLTGIICYQKGEALIRQFQKSKEDDEQDVLDRRYSFWANFGITGTSVSIYLAIAVFAFRARVTERGELGDILLATALLLLLTIVCVFYQVAVIKQIRRKDPLKHGDASDINFRKEWTASCDEAEKRVMYEAGYKAFHVARTILLGATVIAMLGEVCFGAGVMSVVLLTACNISATLIYTYYSAKLDKTRLDV